ncbi:hypothetical protein QVD17_37790 [Tagetes erecta]|uniref:Uncharacterized protein n=1 Tax=Tagetes erecta TaxID=13708 RepID=A0AAD8NKC0_TARER|nr:hypothetical protein QVD17_37790 [Tagetes erecta]
MTTTNHHHCFPSPTQLLFLSDKRNPAATVGFGEGTDESFDLGKNLDDYEFRSDRCCLNTVVIWWLRDRGIEGREMEAVVKRDGVEGCYCGSFHRRRWWKVDGRNWRNNGGGVA